MEIIDRNGKQRTAGDNVVLQEGERLVVRLNVMDGAPPLFHDGMGSPAGRKPGYVFSSIPDRAADDARREYEAHLADAWRGITGKPAAVPDGSASDAYAQYTARIQNAWRSAR